MVVNTYAVYARDMNPLCFNTVAMTQLVTREVVGTGAGNSCTIRRCERKWASTNYALGAANTSPTPLPGATGVARLANLFGEGV